MKKETFYKTVVDMVNIEPNNMQLGNKIRKFVRESEESNKENDTNPMQITIFDVIENNI